MAQIGIYSSSSLSAAGWGFQSLVNRLNSQKPPEVMEKYAGCSLPAEAELQIRDYKRSSKLFYDLDKTALLSAMVAEAACSKFNLSKMGLETGIAVGSSRGPTGLLESSITHFLESGSVPTCTSPLTTYGNLASTVAQHLKLYGSLTAHSATCTGGLISLLQGIAFIKSNMSKAFLAIATEAPLTPFTFAQMKALRILADISSNNPYPCRPLALQSNSEDYTGLILGEASAAFLLASSEEQSFKGITPLAILSSVASASEPIPSATGITPEGSHLVATMKNAIKMSGNPMIDLVLMHAPGTKQGDSAEIAAITEVFKDYQQFPALYSTKWLTGHTFATSGLLSLEVAIALFQGNGLNQLPYPTRKINKKEASDKTEEVDIVSSILDKKPQHILINCAGFGGLAASAVVSRAY